MDRDLVEQLWESDEASALTNAAARYIETLQAEKDAAVLAEREACAQIARGFAEANRREIQRAGLKNRDRTRAGAKVSAFETMENAIRARSNKDPE